MIITLLMGLVLPVLAQAREQRVPILIYHHIAPLPVNASAMLRRWTILPQEFEDQMDWVRSQGFHTISIKELFDHLKHGAALPSKPIVLTFDDGWKNHYLIAYPILKKLHFTATFFIITDSVGHSAYMNWNQVLALAADGMDIQAHTVTHPHLEALSHADALYEITESKKVLEAHLHKPIDILAYPYGTYNDNVIAITKAAGFEGAVSVNGNNDGYLFRADPSFVLPRHAMEGGEDLPAVARQEGFSSR